MTAKIVSSDPTSYFNYNHGLRYRSFHILFSQCCLPKIKQPCHLSANQGSHPFNVISKFNSKCEVIRATSTSDNFQPEAPVPAKPPSSSWKKWIVGLFLSIILPSFGHKLGPFLVLKRKVDATIETVETVTEIAEELAEEAEKLAEEVDNKLPEDTKLKEAVESVENLAKQAVKEAELAKDLIHKSIVRLQN